MTESESIKHLGRMFIKQNLDLVERLTSLEHLSNQHDILLIGLLSGTNPKDVFKLFSGKLDEKCPDGLNEK